MVNSENIFWTKQSCYTHRCTIVELVWTHLEQAQVRENYSVEREGEHEIPLLAEESPAIESYLEKVCRFSLRMSLWKTDQDVTLVDWSLPTKTIHSWVFRQHKPDLKSLIFLNNGHKIRWIGRTTVSGKSVWSGWILSKYIAWNSHIINNEGQKGILWKWRRSLSFIPAVYMS